MLSTYAMTSEGFDNPSLNTLLFATPKTNIEQSVGRILRKVHSINPIIVDIIDNYSLFKIQGYQRIYFYKNKQYIIMKEDKNDKDKDVHLVRIFRSNKSISSGSTYIGHTLSKKSHHKSQLSLYEKITRNMNAPHISYSTCELVFVGL